MAFKAANSRPAVTGIQAAFRFDYDEVSRHIRLHHPGCPDFAVRFFASEIASKEWRECKLGAAVGITMQTFLRHNLTDYDHLLRQGVKRDCALQKVQPKIKKMIASWAADYLGTSKREATSHSAPEQDL